MAGGAAAAGVALFLALVRLQWLDWESPANSSNVSVVGPLSLPQLPAMPDEFNIVPSFEALGSPMRDADAPGSQTKQAATSQESA